jgi:hypothetical protein
LSPRRGDQQDGYLDRARGLMVGLILGDAWTAGDPAMVDLLGGPVWRATAAGQMACFTLRRPNSRVGPRHEQWNLSSSVGRLARLSTLGRPTRGDPTQPIRRASRRAMAGRLACRGRADGRDPQDGSGSCDGTARRSHGHARSAAQRQFRASRADPHRPCRLVCGHLWRRQRRRPRPRACLISHRSQSRMAARTTPPR